MLAIKWSLNTIVLLAILLFNVGITGWRMWPTFLSRNIEVDKISYSYIGKDYPLTYPIGPLDDVAMSLHESVHFSLNASDVIADEEWNLISANPKGVGRTRLGPDHRVFVLAFLHQMHCLRRLQLALLNRDDHLASAGHVNHCLNYLRQTLLCESADTLERGDFMQRDFDHDRLADTVVCRDWEKPYNMFDAKYKEWVQWKEAWNSRDTNNDHPVINDSDAAWS